MEILQKEESTLDSQIITILSDEQFNKLLKAIQMLKKYVTKKDDFILIQESRVIYNLHRGYKYVDIEDTLPFKNLIYLNKNDIHLLKSLKKKEKYQVELFENEDYIEFISKSDSDETKTSVIVSEKQNKKDPFNSTDVTEYKECASTRLNSDIVLNLKKGMNIYPNITPLLIFNEDTIELHKLVLSTSNKVQDMIFQEFFSLIKNAERTKVISLDELFPLPAIAFHKDYKTKLSYFTDKNILFLDIYTYNSKKEDISLHTVLKYDLQTAEQYHTLNVQEKFDVEYRLSTSSLSYVVEKDKTYIYDRMKNNHKYTLNQITQLYANRLIYTNNDKTKKEIIVHPIKYFITDSRRPTYEGTVFDPSKDYDGYAFNTFSGFKVEASVLMDIEPFIKFVNEIGCSSDTNVSQALWSFFAKQIQGHTPKYSALSILSDEDELSQLLLKGFKKVMEEYYMRLTSVKQLTGVNTDFEDRLFIEIDDTFLEDKSALIHFEELVRETNFSYQVKRGVTETKPNYSSCIITSKNTKFISSILKKKLLVIAKMDDDKVEDISYINTIRETIDNPDFAPTLMHYLENYNYQDGIALLQNPSKVLLSNEEIEEGFSTIEKWFYKQLKDAEFVDVATEADSDEKLRVSSKSAFNSFITFAKANGDKVEYTSSALGSKLSRILSDESLRLAGQKLKKHTIPDDVNCSIYAPLGECRKAFESYTGLHNVDWIGDNWQTSK